GASASGKKGGSPTRVAMRRARVRKRRAKAKATHGKSAPVAKASPPPKATAGAAARSAKPGGKKDSLNALIDGALGGKAPAAPKKAASKAAAPDPSLPSQLNMNQIRTVMRKIRGRVQGCYDKFQIEGRATARVQIAPSGRVKSVVIKGKFFGTDTGNCVAKAVRGARFPKFSGKMMTIKYPFLLQ
ncbi:MAG: AgmX/PglI C-terminal domain-containing protein, partial [Myxococcales bacterium]|nr:AgmX/PglI C-terminal domain-containing protein [Myxococcales bacterium]